MSATGDVGKRLVNGNSLDERGEIIEHIDGGVAQTLVFFEMAADKNQVRTECTRLPSRHAAADSERPRFVRCREHHSAADGDRLAAQRRVEQLLDRGVKGVEVRMEYGGCRFH